MGSNVLRSTVIGREAEADLTTGEETGDMMSQSLQR